MLRKIRHRDKRYKRSKYPALKSKKKFIEYYGEESLFLIIKDDY